MGFVRDLTGKTAVNAAKKSGELLTNAALEGSQLQSQGFLDSANTSANSALMAANQQSQGFRDANAAQVQGSNRASALFDPYAQLGQSGVDQAGFLTDPNQQFDFLQNNPLFQMGLDNANQQTLGNAASRGRLSSGDTLQQLTNNSLLTAQPLIQDQKNSIANLLNFGTNAATNQGNILLDQGQTTANSANNAVGAQAQGILNSGNAIAGGQFGSANALADGITNAANAKATGIIGTANARGDKAKNTLELGGEIFQSIFSPSDPQLKTNIVKTGKQNGFNIYAWDWNDSASKLGLTGKGAGVMADEVKAVMPEAVITEQGYMKVNYSMIGVNV
jgi:hypothetical protein